MIIGSDSNGNAFGSTVLSAREMKVVRLITKGLKNKEIGSLVGTTEHGVKNYLRGIYDKLGMNNRVQLAMWYINREDKNASRSI